jgi:hypothetical protein
LPVILLKGDFNNVSKELGGKSMLYFDIIFQAISNDGEKRKKKRRKNHEQAIVR